MLRVAAAPSAAIVGLFGCAVSSWQVGHACQPGMPGAVLCCEAPAGLGLWLCQLPVVRVCECCKEYIPLYSHAVLASNTIGAPVLLHGSSPCLARPCLMAWPGHPVNRCRHLVNEAHTLLCSHCQGPRQARHACCNGSQNLCTCLYRLMLRV